MPPRLLRPKDEVGSSDNGDPPKDVKPGKRRAVSSACIPCRKRKSKCDGNLPACSTCVAVYRTECSYDVDSDHRRKGALKRDIQTLQQRNDALDVIVASLRALPEQEAITLLHSLRSDTSPDVIAASLRSNVSLPTSYAAQSLEADFAHSNRSGASSATSGNTSEPSTDPALISPVPPTSNSTSDPKLEPTHTSWFNTAIDPDFVEHLLELYFCWVHPFYQFFSKDHFLFDFRNGRKEHCSSALVYAILAMACNYSDQSPAQAQSFALQQSEFFFQQAKLMLESHARPSLTMVQACAVLSIRESSCGRDSSGYQFAGRCVRLASEMNLNLSINNRTPSPVDAEVAKITFWGAFTLETMSAVSLGRLSQLPRSAIGIEKPEVTDRIDAQTWRPYHNPSANEQHLEHSSHTTLFSNCLSQLCELASDMANTFYAPKESFTSRKLALAYASYQEWYNQLPEALWLKNTALPHVVVLHMCYHAFVLHLFRPYIKLDLHVAKLYPRETCISCANEISTLMSALRSMHGLRRVSPAVVGMLYSASTIHLLNLPAESSINSLEQAIHDLNAMSAGHAYAQRCVDNIRSLAARWSINLPEGAALAASLQTTGQNTMPSPAASMMPPTSYPQSSMSDFQSDASIKQESYYGNSFAPIQTQNLPNGIEDPVAMTDILNSQMPVWTPISMPTMPFGPSDTDVSVESHQQGMTDWSAFGSAVHPQIPQQQDVGRSSGPSHGNLHDGVSSAWNWSQ